MTVIITPDDIKGIYPNAAGFTDCQLQEFICVVNQADACLQGAGYDDCVISMIKKNAVAHMAYSLQSTNFKSMTSPTGESVTFHDNANTGDLTSTAYGRMVMSLDKSGCVSSIIENTESDRFLVSVGGFC
jgi:hypothetical protein